MVNDWQDESSEESARLVQLRKYQDKPGWFLGYFFQPEVYQTPRFH